MRFLARTSTIFVLATLLISCASVHNSTRNQFVYADTISSEKHYRLALQSLKRKDYQTSLIHWRILKAMKPGNAEYRNRIRVINALAHRQAASQVIAGKNAATSGDFKTATQHFLRALVIEPTNQTALEEMRRINTREVVEVQLSHLEKVKRRQMQQFAESE